MKKILIVGEKYSENLGDGVICDTVCNYYNNDYILKIIDLSGRVTWTNSNNYFSLKKEMFSYLKRYIKIILNFFKYKKYGKNLTKIINDFNILFDNTVNEFNPDVILFAGGQLFNDTFINQINYICKYADKNNIKVVFNSIGYGNLLSNNLLKSILNSDSVEYISVRDNYKIISELTSKNIIDNYDSAIICRNYYKTSINNSKCLGIGIMYSPKQSPHKQIKFWNSFIKLLSKNNIDFKLFTNGSTHDQSFAEYILKKNNLDKNKYLVTKPNKPEELINIINSFNSIISMRLHSLIIAYSYNIPSLSITWDNKVNTFFEKIGCKNRCLSFRLEEEKILDFIKNYNNYNYDENIKRKIVLSTIENLNTIKDIIS